MSRVPLDLRGVACPMNLVRVKLALEPLEPGAELEVWLDPGEPVENVSAAVVRDGHAVLERGGDDGSRVVVRKGSDPAGR